MPKPKLLSTTAIHNDLEFFTDRENICDKTSGSFWNQLSSQEEGEYRVITIQGIAGVGKTTLIKMLVKELEKEHDVFYYKMNKDRNGTVHEKEQFLIELTYKTLSVDQKIKMPRFLYAFGKLHNPVDPENFVINEFKKVHEKKKFPFQLGNSVINDTISLPFKKTLTFIFSCIKDTFGKLLTKEIRKEIDSYDEDYLRKNLHTFLVQDLNKFFNKIDKKPFVFFVDDFERFYSPNGTKRESEAELLWLYELVQALPNVLWVITGRDEISWPEEDEPLNLKLDPFDNKDLVREYFKKYSDKKGVPEVASEIVDYIWKLTGGLPLYLSLCLENYDKAEDKERISKEAFGKDTTELLERFFNNYSERQKNAMLFLCCLPDNWTEKQAYKTFSLIKDKELYGLHLDKGCMDELITTAAFTTEDNCVRIHNVVRVSVLKNAKAFNDIERLRAILNSLGEVARKYEKIEFWGKSLVHRENICWCWKCWSSTHTGYEIDLAKAEMAYAYAINRYYEFDPDNDGSDHYTLAIELFEKALGADAYETLNAKQDYAINCFWRDYQNSGNKATTIITECVEAASKKDWKWCKNYLYSFGNHIILHFPIITDTLKTLCKDNGEEFGENELDIDWNIEEEEEYYNSIKDNLKAIKDNNDLEAEKSIQNYNKFISECSSRNSDSYTEDECIELLNMANSFSYLIRNGYNFDTELENLSDILYKVFKDKNNGHDNKDTIKVLEAVYNSYQTLIDGPEKIEMILKRIYDILNCGEGWTYDCKPGMFIYDLAEIEEELENVEAALAYYKELKNGLTSKNYAKDVLFRRSNKEKIPSANDIAVLESEFENKIKALSDMI